MVEVLDWCLATTVGSPLSHTSTFWKHHGWVGFKGFLGVF